MSTILHLESCPFCGSRNLDVAGWAVQCDDCGALGPLSKGRNAVMLWNQRHNDSGLVRFQLQNPNIPIAPHDM